MAKRLIRPDDHYRLAALGDPRLSPDGARVAWVQTRMDEEKDRAQTSIWVAPVDGSEPPRPLTAGPWDHSPRWSPDGRWLAFVSKTDEDQPAQLWLARLDGGAPMEATDREGTVSQPSWSPDSSRIAYVSAVGVPKPQAEMTAAEKSQPRVVRGLAARLDNAGWLDGRRHVFVLDVSSGESSQVTQGDWHDDMPSWSPDGSLLAFASDRDKGRDDRQLRTDAWIVAVSGGRPRRVTRGWGRAAFPAFSPDGRQLAFVGVADVAGWWSKDPGALRRRRRRSRSAGAGRARAGPAGERSDRRAGLAVRVGGGRVARIPRRRPRRHGRTPGPAGRAHGHDRGGGRAAGRRVLGRG